MKITQNGLIGTLAGANGMLVRNVLVSAQLDDPDNPVAFGYATEVVAGDDVAWSIAGPNVKVGGTGGRKIDLPVGDYEVTIDASGGDHSVGGPAN